MHYHFDTPVNRYGTDCEKFDFAAERHHRPDILSYWVADMDFQTAPEIIQALQDRVAHGIFGYTNIKPHYFEAVQQWYAKYFGYTIERRWLVETPGVCFAIGTALHALTHEGDAVLIQNPVYYPFNSIITKARRRTVSSPLQWDGTEFVIDFDDFERKIIEENVKLFILCSPHNPGGRVWRKEELEKLGDICLRHKVIVVSDEIHSDFTWDGHVHTMFASIAPELEDITVTCTSPSKSFNLAGLQVSNIFIKNKELRDAYWLARDATGYDEPNIMGLTACEVAYTKGEAWFTAVKAYINDNLNKAVDFLAQNGQGRITAVKPHGTYLLWVDCTKLGLADEEINRRIEEDAQLWLDPGKVFGAEGKLFQRFNVATQWSYLEQGLRRFVDALLK